MDNFHMHSTLWNTLLSFEIIYESETEFSIEMIFPRRYVLVWFHIFEEKTIYWSRDATSQNLQQSKDIFSIMDFIESFRNIRLDTRTTKFTVKLTRKSNIKEFPLVILKALSSINMTEEKFNSLLDENLEDESCGVL